MNKFTQIHFKVYVNITQQIAFIFVQAQQSVFHAGKSEIVSH